MPARGVVLPVSGVDVLTRSMAESTRPSAGASLSLAAVKSVRNIIEIIMLFPCMGIELVPLYPSHFRSDTSERKLNKYSMH